MLIMVAERLVICGEIMNWFCSSRYSPQPVEKARHREYGSIPPDLEPSLPMLFISGLYNSYPRWDNVFSFFGRSQIMHMFIKVLTYLLTYSVSGTLRIVYLRVLFVSLLLAFLKVWPMTNWNSLLSHNGLIKRVLFCSLPHLQVRHWALKKLLTVEDRK